MVEANEDAIPGLFTKYTARGNLLNPTRTANRKEKKRYSVPVSTLQAECLMR